MSFKHDACDRTVNLNAYAKINLTLDVGLRRADSYHDIESVMQTVSLHDIVRISIQPSGQTLPLFVVDGPEAANVPIDSNNIVCRAAELMLSRYRDSDEQLTVNNLHIELTKHIPSQAGLGGGSSDAAAVLVGLDELLNLHLSEDSLISMAKAIGADVSFFLYGGTAKASGIGDVIAPLPIDDPGLNIVIAKPPVGVSTPAAYRALDADQDRTPGASTRTWAESMEPPSRRPIHNDFHLIVRSQYPEIDGLLSFMEAPERSSLLAQQPMLCGSGSAVFAIVSGDDAARTLTSAILESGFGKAWYVRSTKGKQIGNI